MGDPKSLKNLILTKTMENIPSISHPQLQEIQYRQLFGLFKDEEYKLKLKQQSDHIKSTN